MLLYFEDLYWVLMKLLLNKIRTMVKIRADSQLKKFGISWVRKQIKQRVLPRPACNTEIKEIQFCLKIGPFPHLPIKLSSAKKKLFRSRFGSF